MVKVPEVDVPPVTLIEAGAAGIAFIVAATAKRVDDGHPVVLFFACA